MTLAERIYKSDFVRRVNQMVARRTSRVNLDIYYSPYCYSSSSWRGLLKPKIAPKETKFFMRLNGLSEREASSIYGIVEEYQGAFYGLETAITQYLQDNRRKWGEEGR